MSSKLLTTGQAAKLCSVTPDTILKWIRSGRLQATRTPGGHHRVSKRELLKVLGGERENGERAFSKAKRHPFRYCWEFNGKGKLLSGCKECIVYIMRAKRCYQVIERAKEIGHNKQFCEKSCENCEYFQVVHQQSANVLLVTDNDILAADLKRSAKSTGFNLEVATCEYTTSALVDLFRPDYAIVDCSLGRQLSRDICDHLIEDPRIPFIRVVLAVENSQQLDACDKAIFARIEKPFGIREVAECISGGWTKETG